MIARPRLQARVVFLANSWVIGKKDALRPIPICTSRPRQGYAEAPLVNAELIAIAPPCLCEFVWVICKVCGFEIDETAAALRALLEAANVAMNRHVVEAGLTVLEAGCDFADGEVAYESGCLGGETCVSFDKKAVSLLLQQGQKTRPP